MAETGTNPYLALLQQQDTGPTWAQVLQNIGNLGFGLAGGFSQAASTGQPTMAGIGPGLMLGNSMNVQAANAAEQDRLKRFTLAMQAQHYGAEDEKLREETAQRKREADITDKLMQGLPGMLGGTGSTTPGSTTPGFQATPPTRLMGPDLKTGGAPIVDYLTTKYGFSPLAAATVAGNLYQESGFNAANNTGDSGSAFGMAQWRLDRQTALRNFAAAQNKPVTDPQVQLDYLVSEMKGGDMGAQRAYAGLQQAKTPEEANTAMMHFFRPAGYTPANPAGGHGFQNRVQNTQALLQNGQPAPQVAQGDAVAPQPRPGPTLSALPAFEGPGAGAIQPGALPPGVAPSVNMPSPAPLPTVMPGGTGVDPNIPPPAFMQTGGGSAPGQPPTAPGTPAPGGPNIVQAQYQPQPGQPTMAVQPPRIDPLKVVPLLQSKTLAPFGQALIGIGNAETQRYLEDLKRQQAEEHFRQTQGLAVRQAKVNPDGTINQSVVDAETAAKKAQLGLEYTEAIDRTTGQVVNIPKSQLDNPQYMPLKANEEARAAAAAKLAQDNAARVAANQDVIIDPATGQPMINEKAVEAKTRISAAQGTDTSSKILLAQANDAIERNKDWQKAGTEAGTTIRNMDIFSRLSDDIKTGKFTGATTDLKAKLKGAGVNLEAWGIPDNVGPAQAMQMMSQRFALEMRREMPGPMSDGDRKFMERGAISIENDPGANKIMSAYLKGNAERAQDRAKFAREYMTSPDFTRRPAGIDDYVEQKLATKDYFDSSVLPKDSGIAKTPWDIELERRGRMNSAAPPGR